MSHDKRISPWGSSWHTVDSLNWQGEGIYSLSTRTLVGNVDPIEPTSAVSAPAIGQLLQI